MEYMLSHLNIWQNPICFFLYSLSIITIITEKDRFNKAFERVIPLGIFSIVIAYFPITFALVQRHTVGGWKYYSQFCALLFIPWVITLSIVICLKRIKGSRRILFLILTVWFMICAWNFGRKLPDWESGLDWYYRIPREAVFIGDYIYDNTATTEDDIIKVLLLTEEKDKEADATETPYYAQLKIGIGNSLRQYMSKIQIDEKSIDDGSADPIEYDTYDYIICSHHDRLMKAVCEYDYHCVKDFGDFCFYASNVNEDSL